MIPKTFLNDVQKTTMDRLLVLNRQEQALGVLRNQNDTFSSNGTEIRIKVEPHISIAFTARQCESCRTILKDQTIFESNVSYEVLFPLFVVKRITRLYSSYTSAV